MASGSLRSTLIKNSMSEFKIHPYLYFYPSDWLNDPEVRRLPPEVKGFYFDLICQLHFTFPYGYCSLLNSKKTKKLQVLVNQDTNLRVELLVSLQVSEQLKLAENIESELDKYLPYKTDQIADWIRILEDRTIISRSTNGILFVRRMVKDFKRRVTAYLNGKRGGNPHVRFGQNIRNFIKTDDDKPLKDNDSHDLVNQDVGGVAYPTADLYSINKLVGRDKGSGERGVPGGKTISAEFSMQGLYEKTFEQLQEQRYSKTLTADGFLEWKKFVDFVVEHNFIELFHCKFITPPDFQTIWNNGFTVDKWEKVVKKILSTGIRPEHNLYFRIPEFEDIVNKKNTKKTVDKHHHLGNRDYSKMKGMEKN